MPTIHGPLYSEVMGPVGAPAMVFLHPNPMDSSCWLYQMAHFCTWYRCVAIDLPGYGRSPSADAGLTMTEIASACWAAVDLAGGETGAVLVGCSVGSYVAQHMYHIRPASVDAVVLCGAGWRPSKAFPQKRIAGYREHGIEYRYEYTLEDFSPEYRNTPMATWFARLFSERNAFADLETIVTMFEALAEPDPEWLQTQLRVPTLILTGSEDATHPASFALRDRLPDSELVVIQHAGHACHIEQPWAFDAEMIRFLRAHGRLQLPVG